jgi:hypothetical protein
MSNTQSWWVTFTVLGTFMSMVIIVGTFYMVSMECGGTVRLHCLKLTKLSSSSCPFAWGYPCCQLSLMWSTYGKESSVDCQCNPITQQ